MQCRDYFKIGISQNPKQRLSRLSCGNPYPIKIIFESDPIPNSYKVESNLHNALNKYHERGEWYKNLSKEEVVKTLNEIISRVGNGFIKENGRNLNSDFFINLFFPKIPESEHEKLVKETEQMRKENEEIIGFIRTLMGNNSPNIYTNLIYRTLFGKTAKELEQEYAVKPKENLRDFFNGEDLSKVQSLEMLVSSLINCGWGYEQIKDFIQKETIKMIA